MGGLRPRTVARILRLSGFGRRTRLIAVVVLSTLSLNASPALALSDLEQARLDLKTLEQLEAKAAIPIAEKVLRTFEENLGKADKRTMKVRVQLALLYGSVGDAAKADELLSQQIEIRWEQLTLGERRGMQSGRSFLVARSREPAGYGLYSYLLFANPPKGEAERKRYLSALASSLRLFPTIEELENSYPPETSREKFGIVLIPVRQGIELPEHFDQPAQAAVAAEEILRNYNYVRAREFLDDLGEYAVESGPYLISRISSPPAGKVRLRQDMTDVDPELIWDWFLHFIWRTAQPRSWSEESLKGLSISIRTELEHVRQVPVEWIQLLGIK